MSEPANSLARAQTGDSEFSALERKTTKRWGFLKLRPDDDTDDQDWWVASVAIPLLAATLAPLANVLSISALVSFWRSDLTPPAGQSFPPSGDTLPLSPLTGSDIPDPSWAYGLNLASLVTGYAGNVFLLMNFTNRIRYIIALPATIILWYVSTAILIAIQVSINTYQPPKPPYEVYTQAFWYGVIAAILYLLCSMMLMVNMVGYFLGHYPQKFNLTDSQRTLILQTFLFFIWLAGGAGVYSKLETDYGQGPNWSFSDALYFCDVTILTVGFGDLVPTEDVGRGLLIPYAIGGIIMLGLMVSSITTFAKEIGQANIVQKRANRQRLRTLEKSRKRRASSAEPRKRLGADEIRRSLSQTRANPVNDEPKASVKDHSYYGYPVLQSMKRTGSKAIHKMQGTRAHNRRVRRHSTQALRQEKDRFDAMRKIQHDNSKFKQWTALCLSTTVLCVLWFIGAVVFWKVEHDAQGMTYFEAIYFCFVSLLTIGYGDFAPVTNAGRPFFVVWSLLAIPSITILISNMADTVVAAFKRGTDRLASFTLLPEHGIWGQFLEQHPWLRMKVEAYESNKAAEKRIAEGFETGLGTASGNTQENNEVFQPKTLEELALQASVDEHELANNLSMAIRKTAEDFRKDPNKRYGYEEWAEFTTLIRFTRPKDDEDEGYSEDEGLIEWDWIGEDSPMMAEKTEAEWLLDRLCESMGRYVKHQRRQGKQKKTNTVEGRAWQDHHKRKAGYDGIHDGIQECSDDDEIEEIKAENESGSGSSPTLRTDSGS